jgi:hypothetical protein
MRTDFLLVTMVALTACAANAGCGRLADIPADTEPADAGASGGGSASGTATSTGDSARDAGPAKGDASTAKRSGRCAKDADCNTDGRTGGHCVELVPGGYRVCSYPPPAPEICTNDPSSQDECCGTCAGGTCTLSTSCGGAYIAPHNICAVSDCASNADCGQDAVCLPTGVGDAYARRCMTKNECLLDADCTAAPGGTCALLGMTGPLGTCAPWTCPGGEAAQVAIGLVCVYGSECAADEDCPNGHCEEVGGRRQCKAGVRSQCPPPP